MERDKRVYIYIADRVEFDTLVEQAAEILKQSGEYQLSQYEGQQPSVSRVLIAALKEVVKNSQNQS
jgi:hypothetical protein